jgi:hypothetical protein
MGGDYAQRTAHLVAAVYVSIVAHQHSYCVVVTGFSSQIERRSPSLDVTSDL